jgi:hypothetical protein
MKILIKDVLQIAGTAITLGDSAVLTPSLQDISTDLSYTFTFASTSINCICLGNFAQSGGVTLTVKLYNAAGLLVTRTRTYGVVGSPPYTPFSNFFDFFVTYPAIIKAEITFTADLLYIGRIALGLFRDLPIYKSREPGFITTYENRKTIGGQVVMGVGGVAKRTFSVELKGKITSTVLIDYIAMKNILPAKFPYFIDFTDEAKWLGTGLTAFYAIDNSEILLQSTINSITYSKKFNFEECF